MKTQHIQEIEIQIIIHLKTLGIDFMGYTGDATQLAQQDICYYFHLDLGQPFLLDVLINFEDCLEYIYCYKDNMVENM